MRRPSSVRAAPAARRCLVVATGAGAGAAPPDDDRTADALEQFTDLAARLGYTLVDPACATTAAPDDGDTYTCYAMTSADGAFMATTTFAAGDVAEFEILVAPDQPLDVAAPEQEPGAVEATAGFEALAYFDSLFSGDPAAIATLQTATAAGSPAEAYALYQLAYAEIIASVDGEIEPSYVYLDPEGVLVCVTEELCVYATDLTVVDGQLVDFAVDGNEIAPRLGRPGDAVTVGPATARVRAAYRAVTGSDALRVYVDLSATQDTTFELSKAVYVDADGDLTSVDLDSSIGAVDGTAREQVSVALDFPGVDPGGEVRFLVFPRGADAPLAVVLPVEAMTGG